jgi:hypothetical protein
LEIDFEIVKGRPVEVDRDGLPSSPGQTGNTNLELGALLRPSDDLLRDFNGIWRNFAIRARFASASPPMDGSTRVPL